MMNAYPFSSYQYSFAMWSDENRIEEASAKVIKILNVLDKNHSISEYYNLKFINKV